MELRRSRAGKLILIVALLLPLLLLIAIPAYRPLIGLFWVWLMLLGTFIIIWNLLALKAQASGVPSPEDELPVMLPEGSQDSTVREILDVKMATREHGADLYEGRLLRTATDAFQILSDHFRGSGRMPIIQEGQGGRVSVAVVPRPAAMDEEKPVNPWVPLGLVIATLFTTIYAGAAYQGVNLIEKPAAFAAGLPYAIGLMLILGLHELGHFFTARYHKMKVTPPFFIPVPFALGTFGAFIQLRSSAPKRRALFDVAFAGPLAGLVVAIPALLIGLHLSQIVPSAAGQEATAFAGSDPQSSILLALLAKLSLGAHITGAEQIVLHPLAFAGWLGLIVTALNLLPIGQLDGGHIAHAMFGRRTATVISQVGIWGLFLLALFVVPGLFIWAIIVFFIAGTTDAPALDDITPINSTRQLLGIIAFVILLLILLPVPQGLAEIIGLGATAK